MKYLSLILTILFLSLIWACSTQEEDLSSQTEEFIHESLVSNNSQVQVSAFENISMQTKSGTQSFDFTNPSEDLIKILKRSISVRETLQRSTPTCEAPCELGPVWQGSTNIQGTNCGEGGCRIRFTFQFCAVDVIANGTTEIYIENVTVTPDDGSCIGYDMECVRIQLINELIILNSATTVYQDGLTSNDPIPCGGPTVGWSSFYSVTSCSSNCEGFDCGDACCQFYSSLCINDEGRLEVGRFTGSNQISDCSGNTSDGCECFQSSCENQYDF